MNKKAAKTATIVMLQAITLILVVLGIALGIEWLISNGYRTVAYFTVIPPILCAMWIGIYFVEK